MAEQRSRPWAVEDFSAAFIKFRSGVTAIVHGAELTDYEYCSFMLSGSTGVIRMQDERCACCSRTRADSEPDSGFQWRQLAEVCRSSRRPRRLQLQRRPRRAAGRAGGQGGAAQRRPGRAPLAGDDHGRLPVATPGQPPRLLPGDPDRLRECRRCARQASFGPSPPRHDALTRREVPRTVTAGFMIATVLQPHDSRWPCAPEHSRR